MDTRQWLAQVKEETLEPDLPVCDPHHHLWDHPDNRYLLDELLEDTSSGHNVVSTVFVECASMYRAEGEQAFRPVGETEFVQGVAAMSASGNYGSSRIAAGIVGFADLTLGQDVRQVLEAHMAASPNRFRGIRHATGWHESDAVRNSHTNPSKGLMMDPDFREGLEVVGVMGLTFDAWFYHHQMAEFVSLAKSCPDVTLILDHFGGPLGIGPFEGKREEVFRQWRDEITALESCPNVYFKLGGVNMKINGFGWHKRERPPTSDELVDATAPWYEHCIDTFGPDRCMLESNFPVDKASVSYNTLWNAFKKMTASRTPADRQKLLHDTAVRVYQLPDHSINL